MASSRSSRGWCDVSFDEKQIESIRKYFGEDLIPNLKKFASLMANTDKGEYSYPELNGYGGIFVDRTTELTRWRNAKWYKKATVANPGLKRLTGELREKFINFEQSLVTFANDDSAANYKKLAEATTQYRLFIQELSVADLTRDDMHIRRLFMFAVAAISYAIVSAILTPLAPIGVVFAAKSLGIGLGLTFGKQCYKWSCFWNRAATNAELILYTGNKCGDLVGDKLDDLEGVSSFRAMRVAKGW